jgi:outer membrane protein TolC
MKSLRHSWRVRAQALAIGALLLSPGLYAADTQVVPSRPGARVARPLPEPVNGEIRLSLTEAIALALANNADLNVFVNTAEAQRYNLMVSEAIFDPNLIASAIRNHSETPATSTLVGAAVNKVETFNGQGQISQLTPIGGTFTMAYAANRTATNSSFSYINPSFSSNWLLSLSQPLLRNFGITPTYWQIKISRNTQDSAYLDFVKSVQTVVDAVDQSYWDLVYAIQNLEVKKESLRIAQDLNRITKIKIDVGSLAPIDIVQTEVGVAQAEQDIITADGLVGDAQDRLKRALNFDQDRWTSLPIAPTDKVEASEGAPINVDEAIKVALERRPEMQQSLLAADSAKTTYAYWRNESLPALNLVGSFGTLGVGGSIHILDENGNQIQHIPGDFGDAWNNMVAAKNKNWSFGLTFSYPILNRYGRGNLGAAKYTYESSRAKLTQTEQNVLLDVRGAVRAIDTAAKSIVAARKGRELAERNLDAERKKFENGMSTTFQVNQIQRDLSAARTTEEQALAVYRKAVSTFHLVVADILDWKSVQVEAPPDKLRTTIDLRRSANE